MRNSLSEKLNKEQLKAVTHKDGPLLIVAGAGTGKTTVITRKIAYIIEQGWAKSDEILALTFTEKAAGEMEERVDKLLPMGYLDLWISTFHSFGERILKEHGLEIGLPADFKLLNEFEQWSLVRKNLGKFDLDYYRPMGNPTKFIHALIKHFSRAKDEDISPADYLKYAEELRQNMDTMLSGSNKKRNKKQDTRNKQISSRNIMRDQISNFHDSKGEFNKEIAEQEIMRINEVANSYHVYQQLLLDNSFLDFGDLINYSLKLFRERPAVLEKYRNQFKYILLDEFQDTNLAQYELIKMLAEPKNNLTVVGDDDQSVYAFRGASMSNVLQFINEYPESKKVILINNYRNKQNILDLSYEFIKLNNPNRLEYQLAGCRMPDAGCRKLNKKLIAEKKGKGVIEIIKGSDLQDEVRLVVEKIAELKIQDKQANWNDFAVLVRANESAKDFCNTLEIAGLPYQFFSSRGLYAKPIIMDVIAYLKLLDDYHESAAVYRILNLPIFNFSYKELVNFNYVARKKAWSLWTVLRDSHGRLGSGIQNKIDKVLSLTSKHTAMARDKSVSEIVMAFLNDSGYLKYLTSPPAPSPSQGDGEYERKSRENMSLLNQFVKRIKKFESANDDKSVKAFLAELNMEIESGEQGSLSPDIESGPEAIKIMTVHAAKGLEFKYLFIANMVDKRFPTIERKEPILIPDDLIKEILPEGDIHLEEERRLFYVAMTRAKKAVYFSWAPDYGGVRKKKPSRFLAETKLIGNIKDTRIQETITRQIINSKLQITHNKLQQNKEIDIKIPNYFSYTQLAAFSNCPYQYRFAHILRVPIRGKPVFSFGKTMHSTLQKTFELINEKKGLGQGDLFTLTPQPPLPAPHPPTPSPKQEMGSNNLSSYLGGTGGGNISMDEILELYEQSWIDDWYESNAQKQEYKKKGREILKEFYAKHHRQGGTGQDDWPKAAYLEKGFNIKLRDNGEIYTIRGVIDRIDEEGGKLKIIDYKTGSPKDKLSFKEKEQLLIYQMAVREIFRQDISSLAFYYLNNNSEVEFLGTDEDLDKTKDKILNIIKDIKKGEFPAKPSQLCKFCDFKSICEFRKS